MLKTLTFYFSHSSLCNFPLPPRAALRGLCKNRLLKYWYLFGFSWLSATNAMFLCQLRLSFRLVDVFYTMRWDPTTNMPFYLGFLKSVIRYRSQKVLTFSFQSMTISLVNFSRYDEDAETWHLTSSDGLVNGTSPAPINSMGTGLQTWQFDR